MTDGPGRADGVATTGLRARKKRDLRRRLSETATALFLERGYDEVRVADIAAACDVSAKTLYNYFPTKESLLFDRGEALAVCLEAAGDEADDLVEAVVSLVKDDVRDLVAAASASSTASDSEGIGTVQAFAALVASKPSLQGAVGGQIARLTQLAAGALADRRRTDADAPEIQIAASALISLWQVELRGLLRFAGTDRPLTEVRDEVVNDVDRGARVVRALWRSLPTA